MRIAVTATDEQWEELQAIPGTADCVRVPATDAATGDFDAWLLLQPDAAGLPVTDRPVLLHAVTSSQTGAPGVSLTRINGWKGFLARPLWEVAGRTDAAVLAVVEALGRQARVVADEPGLVAARVLAMIINEAYFALGEGVSTRADIDTAMKLGTNYPFGPFEWAERIGTPEIYQLLKALESTDSRYRPAPLLEEEARS